MSSPIAIIAGVGPGTGSSIARLFARTYPVVLLSRSPQSYSSLVSEIKSSGGQAIGISTDTADPASMKHAFTEIEEAFGGGMKKEGKGEGGGGSGDGSTKVAAAVYNVGGKFIRKGFLELSLGEFESGWEANGRGAFLFSQHVLPLLLNSTTNSSLPNPSHPPTLLFTGATAAMKGSALTSAFSTGKFALRSLTQSLAKEFGPRGIHVCHAIVDGVIDTPKTKGFMEGVEEGKINPEAIAETYWYLHTQPRTTFTNEIDLRPAVEKW